MVADGLAAIVKLTMVSGFCQDCTLYFNKKNIHVTVISFTSFTSLSKHTQQTFDIHLSLSGCQEKHTENQLKYGRNMT